jgi:hypothetical protein
MTILKYSALALSASVAACGVKDANFTNLQSATSLTASPIPAATLPGPFHTNHFGVVFTPANAVNPLSVSATANGPTLMTTQNGNEFDFSLVGQPDGQTAVTTRFANLAGDPGTVTINGYLLNTGPKITATTPLPTAITATGTTVQLNWSGTIDNKFIGLATGSLLMPGPTNTCTDASTPIPTGIVSGNTWNYLSTVKANGTYSASAVVTDPSPMSSAPTTVIVCNVINASDIATGVDGNPNPNQRKLTGSTNIVFPHASSQLTITTSYTFDPTLKRLCIAVNTSAARAGQTFAGTVTGPGGTTQSFTGVIDSTGAGHSTISITQTGAYNGSVVLGTLQATFSVTIPASGGTSGTC